MSFTCWRPRVLLCWVVVTAAVPALGLWLDPPLHPDELLGARLDEQLAGACALALLLCASWAWWVVTVVSLEALGAATSDTARAGLGVPAWARRVVLTACGTAVIGAGVTVSPAHADGPPPRDPGPVSLAGLPFPDRPSGGLAPIRQLLSAAPPSPATTVVVQPGDSLWSLAQGQLPHGRTPEVAAATRALYDRNRGVIGDDPDVIHPHQQLRLPASLIDRSTS